MVKRLFDISFSILVLLVLFPLFLFVPILIVAKSSAPIFYLGTRTGFKGRSFKIIKFRSMVQNAEKIGGGTTALNDPRVTAVGKWLRRTKIDEIPQFINVLIGQMSVVGPRPELPRYTSRYSGDMKLVLDVKPGITDLASIYFNSLDQHVGATDADITYEKKVFERKNRLRLFYVRKQSFALDCFVICRTVKLVFLKIFSYAIGNQKYKSG
jgi:lipopolysaccharide/colanic/teichoic acid biosynthesis glycosyltransferase